MSDSVVGVGVTAEQLQLLRRDVRQGLGMIAGLLLVLAKDKVNNSGQAALPGMLREIEASLKLYVNREE